DVQAGARADSRRDGERAVSGRWTIEDVVDMQGERAQFAHVAKHLYNPSECWHQVIADLGEPRLAAWSAGCSEAELTTRHRDCRRVTASCREHVLRDHDEVLAPAYRKSLRTAGAARRVGMLVGQEDGWMFVDD